MKKECQDNVCGHNDLLITGEISPATVDGSMTYLLQFDMYIKKLSLNLE